MGQPWGREALPRMWARPEGNRGALLGRSERRDRARLGDHVTASGFDGGEARRRPRPRTGGCPDRRARRSPAGGAAVVGTSRPASWGRCPRDAGPSKDAQLAEPVRRRLGKVAGSLEGLGAAVLKRLC
ncbi:transmembrane protein 60 isoform X4 [Equus asinus]|uniref:transmembrane protein 60 isoform X4 n=1 Tax=Equus asinus TaxID=9793 RepID=UPI0038F6F639